MALSVFFLAVFYKIMPMIPQLSLNTTPFDRIWTQLRHLQNRHSSSWWFFLLFPRQKDGFGPKQMMFALVSRAGQTVEISHVPHPGLVLHPSANGGVDRFNTFAVGWINDGQTVHEKIVHHPATAQLSPDGALHAWGENGDAAAHGGSLQTIPDKPFGIEAQFRGERGAAHFQVWGDPAYPLTGPIESDVQTFWGGANVVYWPHLRFAGEFHSPAGSEWLEGIGYFQRVCLNFPAFPWKWIWATFADESIFSAFVPYVGPHLLRRGHWFFPHWLERAAASIKPSAYFAHGGSWYPVEFEQTQVSILPARRGHPHFAVRCQAKNGDFIQYRLEPHAHTGFLLDRPRLGGWWRSRFNYNEYLFQIQELSGRIFGKPLKPQSLGSGFGNLEYTWGLGI
ncbi:MAG: hypothetical protein KJ063_15005 [Anaerolineae bacterium]|nr:hypothetical protein [Anaerolineae bacterium]